MSDPETAYRKARILVADDEDDLLTIMSVALAPLDAEITLAKDGKEAIHALTRQNFDLVIADQNMPGALGTDILRFCQESKPNPPVFILVTAFGTIDMAVQAMRTGAYDFIRKPFDVEEFANRVRKALETLNLEKENRTLRRAVESHYVFSEIIGTSRALRAVLDLASRVAEQSSPVLLLGESGTGKDLLARAIHFHGPRRKKPFIPINCGAIPENLMESEFFGHKKGSFTGAISHRRGCFEEVAGGTLFLDEIGEMSYDLQVKLLRVLEERKIRRIGENVEIPVDFRIIAAANRSLSALVDEGRFRQDLYYRLNVLTVELPPLRERREDIVLLANHFLKKAQEEMGSPVKTMTQEALDLLQTYDYPGNVRELINILQRATLLSDSEVLEPHHLPDEVRQAAVVEAVVPEPGNLDLKGATRRAQRVVEKRLLERALREANGNHKRAAQLLGISRGSLYNKIRSVADEIPEAG
jgi:two-component system response regulator PilR (NtrC family)